MPRIVPGDVLRLAASDWKYGDGPLIVRVERVRDDLSRYYNGEWVWVEGQRLSADGTAEEAIQVLVRVTDPTERTRRAGHNPGPRWPTNGSGRRIG